MFSLPPFRVALQATAILLVLGLACGCTAGGDGDGDQDAEEILDQRCIEFGADAEIGQTQMKVVAMKESPESTCGRAVVEVLAKDVSTPGVHTVGFTVIYDSKVVKFDRVSTDGSILRDGGTNLTGGASTRDGEVDISFARESTDEVDINGTQLLMKLFFSKVGKSGSSEATMRNLELLDDGGAGAPSPIGGVTGIDGAFLIR